MIDADDSFTVEFAFEENFIDYYYVESGVTVVDLLDDSNYVLFELTALDGECRFELFTSFVDDIYQKNTIYTFSTEGMIFISDVSEDTACLNALKYLVEQGLMTVDEVQDEYSFYIDKYFPETEPIIEPEELDPLSEGVSIASGTIVWQFDEFTEIPLMETRVDLYCLSYEEIFIKTVYTNENGEFEIIYDSTQDGLGAGYELYIRVYCESHTFKVSSYWLTEAYNIIPGLKTGSSSPTGLNYRINNDGSDIYRAFVAEQGMVIAQRYAKSKGEIDTGPKKLNVAYPVNHGSMCIDLGFTAICSIEDIDYIDWLTLGHEYGHFVQRKAGILDITLWDYLFKGRKHSPGDDQIYKKPDKEHAMNLAYSEAWAFLFSMMAYDYYPVNYVHFGTVTNKIDITNNFSANYDSGEGQEAAIIALLWDIFGERNYGLPSDSLTPLGHDEFWAITGESGTYKLMDFLDRLEDIHPEFRSEIGTRLSHFKIAPQGLSLTNIPDQSTPPSFSWIVNGSQYNPNNEFSIVFYDEMGDRKYTIDNVAFSLAPNSTYPTRQDLNIASYTLKQAEWDAALLKFPVDSVMNILVRGYLNSDPRSGPYWSEYYAISAPAVYSTTQVTGGVSITGLNGKLTGDVELPSMIFGQAVVSIDSRAFASQTTLNSIIISNTVTTIGTEAFYRCLGLTSVNIPNSVTSIGDNAFLYCEGLTNIFIPDSVLSIGTGAFDRCSGLTTISLSNSLTSIADDTFCKSGLTSIIIPNNVTSIGTNAFRYCENLTSITLPNSITTIGQGAFSYCSELTGITIPSNVISIANYTFQGCHGLTSFIIPSGVTSIGTGAFYGCIGIANIEFPSSVKTIGPRAFRGCSAFTEVTIPSTVTSVGEDAFFGCNNLSITWNYNPQLTAYGFKDKLTNVVFPSYVTSISNYAFEDCSKLSSITIPNSVTSIGYQAFKGCTNLSEIILPSDLTYIADSTFFGCFSLTSIILPESLESIYDSAFYQCYSLTSINIPESVTYIGYGVFGECVSLTSITIPSGVNSIKPETFYYCLSLQNVVISLGVEYIEFNAFRYCTNLRTITLPESITYIGIQAFSNCTNLGLVHLKREAPDITLIDEYAFDDTNARINVPKRSFIEYKTSPDLEDYRNRIICTTLTETGLDHYSFSDYTLTREIDVGNNEIFVIHIMDTGTYRIESSSNSAIQMAIYDEDMNLISTITYLDPSNTSGYIENTFSSLWDMYYLVISFTDPTVSGTIETSFMWLN
ncbi:MAG: leucine-rich repeat domain-containing protein [Bacilli bacterium]